MNPHDATGTDVSNHKNEDEDEGDEASAAALREKLTDALTPGYQAELDPDEADMAGAFVEDALSESDAFESSMDLDIEPNVDLAGASSMVAPMPVAANDGE